MANRIDMKVDLPTDAELKKMFDAVPMLKKHDVMNVVLRAGGRVVVTRARKEAPRSTPADRAARSKSQKAEYDWENPPLWKTIAMVVRKGDRSGIAIVGPKFPDGNKAYFNQPRAGSRSHKLWGRDVGRVYVVVRNWLAIAFDSTKPQQLAAMKTAMRKKIDEVMRDA